MTAATTRTRAATAAALCLFVLLGSAPAVAVAETRPAPAASTAPAAKRHDPARWEKEIAAFERADRENPPPRGGVVFVGTSAIRLWKTLAADFPDHAVINRGFGGAHTADVTHFAERIIFPYAPRTIVIRAGGNDIHAGMSPEQVAADFATFVETVRARLPEARIVYLSTSPAPARWEERDEAQAANALIAEYAKRTPGLTYVETYDLVLNPDGTPRDDVFVADRLHFTPVGYQLLADRVRPYLSR
jgi:lysophospholipase L1-like esterase